MFHGVAMADSYAVMDCDTVTTWDLGTEVIFFNLVANLNPSLGHGLVVLLMGPPVVTMSSAAPHLNPIKVTILLLQIHQTTVVNTVI